jgi:fructose-bisphosphate aldolase, class I
MSTERLRSTARALVAPGRGILAADESTPTITKRLQAHRIPSTEWTRRDWRELLITAIDAKRWISGVILYDETIHQLTGDGTPFPEAIQRRGMIPGIKVDIGTQPLPGSTSEKVTEGLDGLEARLTRYAQLGARFAKWRAIFTIADGLPSNACLQQNAERLARYAARCQQQGLVPIIEPEVLIEGEHSLERCAEVTEQILAGVFQALRAHDVDLEGALLKANMVLAGADCPQRADAAEVAAGTLRCMRAVLPAALCGVVFLSGGQDPREATANLRAINSHGRQPWELSFSFGRALQQDALAIWGGDPDRAPAAQAAFLQRARANGLARVHTQGTTHGEIAA